MLKVLFVDDEQFILDGFTRFFRGKVDLVTATNVIEAFHRITVAAAEGNPFDAIVTDKDMPARNGIDLLKMVREAGHTTPMIIISGTINDGEPSLIERGFDAALAKPVRTQKLLDEIERVVAKYRTD